MDAANSRQLEVTVAVSLARARMVRNYAARTARRQHRQQTQPPLTPRLPLALPPRPRAPAPPGAAATASPPPPSAVSAWQGWPQPVGFTERGAGIALSEGGAVAAFAGDGSYASAVCGAAPMSYASDDEGDGHFYVEVTWLAAGSGAIFCAGVVDASFEPTEGRDCAAHTRPGTWMYDAGWRGHLWRSERGCGATRSSWEGRRPAKVGDCIGLLLDLSERSLSVCINGELVGVMVTRGLVGPLRWAVDLAGEGTRVRIASAPLPSQLSTELRIRQHTLDVHATVRCCCACHLLSPAAAGAGVSSDYALQLEQISYRWRLSQSLAACSPATLTGRRLTCALLLSPSSRLLSPCRRARALSGEAPRSGRSGLCTLHTRKRSSLRIWQTTWPDC
jgi:hypothetical protein